MAPATKKKKATGVSRSYTVLRKPTLDPKKKVSSQGTSRTTTKTGTHLAARVAIRRRTRPSRIYLYRKKRITTYSIKYSKNKDGKTKASAKQIRTAAAKRGKTTKKATKKKRTTTKRKTTKRKTTKRKTTKRKTPTAAEIRRKIRRLSQML